MKVRINVCIQRVMTHSAGETMTVGLAGIILRGLFFEVSLRIALGSQHKQMSLPEVPTCLELK